jgi:ATP-dependent Clp endopeptidase proteolytic subunit ClpP
MATSLRSSQGSSQPPKRVFAAAKTNNELELLVYDSIGESFWGGGVTAEAVKQKLNEAGDVSKITLRINSPGGDVFEAAAIYSLLTQHKASVECYVDGLAASAAFTIAMAADDIHISESAMMMLHNAWGMCMGYASDMQAEAELLDKVSSTMQGIYSNKSGMKADDVQDLMDAETWMTAAEAVEYGFADDMITRDPEDEEDAKALAASYDLSKFKRGPRAEKDTKRVGGKDCTKSCFAYRPDDNKANWKLPIESPDNDAEWEKTHIRNAISRWSSTDMPDASEKSNARGRIKAAAKKYDIELDEDSLKDSVAAEDEPDEGDCLCACAQCKAGSCGICSDPDCSDANCGPACQEDSEAAALAEVERLREEITFLAI